MNYKWLFYLSLCICFIVGCKDNYDMENAVSYENDFRKTLTRSYSNEEPVSPLLTGKRIEIPNESYKSYQDGYTAENIGFVSEQDLFAWWINGNDTAMVKTFQNIVKITDESNNLVKEVLVTLVPTETYFHSNKSINWENFLFYNNTSDFSGYELYADPENGKVYGIWNYYNGKRQYGTILRENDRLLNMKQAFLLKLLQNISFVKIDKKKSRDTKYIEEVENIDFGDGYIITIVWVHIIPEKDSQQDCDDPRSDYFVPSGGAGGKDDIDILQKDEVKNSGNIFFKEPIISSYLIEDQFPEYGYDSSPCLAVSLALKYFGVDMTPETIWSEIDTPDYSYNIFNDYIASEDLEMLLSKHLLFYKCSPTGIQSAIKTGKCCVAVSRTGLGACVYKCMLIIGYTCDGDFIYLDPVTGVIKCRTNDFLEDYSFVITGKK